MNMIRRMHLGSFQQYAGHDPTIQYTSMRSVQRAARRRGVISARQQRKIRKAKGVASCLS